MTSLSISIPESAFSVFGSSDEAAGSILEAAVVKWVELGRLSQGKAAEILGIGRAVSWSYSQDTTSRSGNIRRPIWNSKSKMQEIIVSDTSCLIILTKIGRLDILGKVFGGAGVNIRYSFAFYRSDAGEEPHRGTI